MIKVIFPPEVQSLQYYSLCVSLIAPSDVALKGRLIDISNHVEEYWKLFDSRVQVKQFHMFESCLPPVRKRLPPGKKGEKPVIEPVIIAGSVSKDDLIRLYDRYMVKGRKDAKFVYNKLRAASHNICALCGIAPANSLDHYLPKARYPIFSVSPRNLVPACVPCNTTKGDPSYSSESELHLYPYNDSDNFYDTDWIDASIEVVDGILDFDFFANPPVHWSQTEKNRVITHFRTFGLDGKYKVNSMQLITTIMFNIRSLLVDGDYLKVKSYYLSLVDITNPNSTFRIMYKAVAGNDAICSGDF